MKSKDYRKTYKYDDPKFLNHLVMYLANDRCEFDATLFPDIPEFLSHLRNTRLSREEKDLMFLPICEKHGIMPFWNLILEGGKCEIKCDSYQIEKISKKIYYYCIHPAHLAQGKKWFSIKFTKGSGEVAKTAIAEFVKRGYVVSYIDADLNPTSRTSDHYYDIRETDANLFAGDGEIDIRSRVPIDLDLEKISAQPIILQGPRLSLKEGLIKYKSFRKK